MSWIKLAIYLETGSLASCSLYFRVQGQETDGISLETEANLQVNKLFYFPQHLSSPEEVKEP
ncbi:hypothetical protein Pint_08664 [Pistacia integerrima]|uniref:Uncharacterized protein n=1 Tax=Pistacia integerrima TaxID=434235 RepID=A0ACC0XVF9_9ROSI|nr:hypothetical protein Pint_08664 [Pistacia integerrima]